MKFIKLTLYLYLLIAVYSCHTKKSNKEDPAKTEVIKQTTEKSIPKKSEQNIQENLQPIELVVKEMLITSPRYIKITKGLQEKVVENGGLYFGVYLERSPVRSKGKEDRYSTTYDFTIYEMYEERQYNTSYFSFNPDNKQLFEYDMSNDKLVSIEFDRTLLLKYDSLNK